MATATEGPDRATFVRPQHCDEVLDYLSASERENLLLIDLVQAISRSGDSRSFFQQVLAARQGQRLIGVASLRPMIAVDQEMSDSGLHACLPLLSTLEAGLVKTHDPHAAQVWSALEKRGRRASIDREEITYSFAAAEARSRSGLPGLDPVLRWRPARQDDLPDLVFAARASLREEGRPDPFKGDRAGFERWVRNRIGQARVVEQNGRVVFVGYADIQSASGWLLQGVYTWPDARRQGYAKAGLGGFVREAFASGASHVQLAVVRGNQPAVALYEGLGFREFGCLRTILFD